MGIVVTGVCYLVCLIVPRFVVCFEFIGLLIGLVWLGVSWFFHFWVLMLWTRFNFVLIHVAWLLVC